MLVVRPVGKGPFAGIIYQHGGGQSMMTYLAEAEVLARAGAVSLILDAPGNAPGKFKPVPEMSGAEFREKRIIPVRKNWLPVVDTFLTPISGLGFVMPSTG